MPAIFRPALPRIAPPAAAALALTLGAALPMAGCTQAYMETMRHEMQLTPSELLAVRATEASESLAETRQSLLHLDDALRQFSLTPGGEPEHAHTDLQRLSELAQAATLDARRRMASVNDVAPDYLATVSPGAPGARLVSELGAAIDDADRALQSTFDLLDNSLPTLGVAPSPGAADAIREQIRPAIAAVDRATQAAERLAGALGADRGS